MKPKRLSLYPNTIRHTPERMCMGCRKKADKRTLIRLACIAGDRVDLDLRHSQSGRGAYLCRALSCWQTALKRRSLEKALRLSRLHPDDWSKLMQYAQCLEQE